jgi:hypothetical protein
MDHEAAIRPREIAHQAERDAFCGTFRWWMKGRAQQLSARALECIAAGRDA